MHVQSALVPDLEETVPRTSRNGHAVLRYAQTTDAVIVASEDAFSGKGD